jgi:hypothetical protein
VSLQEKQPLIQKQFDPRNDLNVNYDLTVRIEGFPRRVHKHVRDTKNYVFIARTKLPRTRYYEVSVGMGDQFYYQHVILNHPSYALNKKEENEHGDNTFMI